MIDSEKVYKITPVGMAILIEKTHGVQYKDEDGNPWVTLSEEEIEQPLMLDQLIFCKDNPEDCWWWDGNGCAISPSLIINDPCKHYCSWGRISCPK